MANVSDCGELHNELWKLLDMDELFARVPLPYDVLIDMPELDDALPATHSAVESSFGRPATESRITAEQKHSVPVNTKTSTN